MALKISHTLICIFLWLSLLLLVFHELYNFKTNINNKKEIINTSAYYSSVSRRHPLLNRKVLAAKFDFTPFQKKRRPRYGQDQRRHGKPSLPDKRVHKEGDGNEIDPRYGVEKRLVPTGPNPLHH
ncbi:hypothetical protein P3X46_031292 [Hevea brasiliensis]|uniref:Uncharacterized protein n=1 Tax=Hevea brasiliensis TaxID=3981 RepID=A0ABQ9KLI7_HEVBR|nr:CLAVATA3/ESR (CLE)-related protein 12-like [Hevea brasiliensis]KAJ9140674.1 hypothetical protein P3X46_031292 [Hevea brasiliensis]